MPTRRSKSRPSRSGGSFLPFFLGVLVTLAAVLAGGWAYLHYGHPRASLKKSAALLATSPPPPLAHPHLAPSAPRPHDIKQPPFGISEDLFESGAHTYAAQCAACHGIPGHDAVPAPGAPAAPQLWRPLPHSLGIGVSNLPPGETFSRIEDGVHPPAMPGFRNSLTPTQIWQVTLLLKNANQPLPNPVLQILQSAPHTP